MVIAYDASSVAGQSGIERYSRELLRSMILRDGQDELVLVSDTDQSPTTTQLFGLHPRVYHASVMVSEHRVVLPLRRAVRVLRQRQLTRAVRSADVVHLLGPQKIVPQAKRLVVTIHDLFPMDPTMELDPILIRKFPARITRQLRAASAVVTPSAYTAASIRERFPWYTGAVHVTPLAAGDEFVPSPLRDATRLQYDVQKPYLLFIGRVDGRKNLRRILEAWLQVSDTIRREHRLILLVPGSPESLTALRHQFRDAFQDDSIRLYSNVPSGDMIELLSSAQALVFSTLGEGFGLPVIEAMRCGCPVITSNNTSLPEVGGDAALYVDPRRVDEIANAMERCLTDSELNHDMRRRGLLHSATFTWERTAQRTYDAYDSIMD